VAHTRLQINFETPEGSIFPICRDAGVTGDGANEVYHSLDAVRVWRDRFEKLFGEFRSCVHHSNPDDPPDLTFDFSGGPVEVEHTRLEPSHLGWTNALHSEVCPDQCITLPSISQQPRNRKELLEIMLVGGGDWSDVGADLSDWFRFLLGLIWKKIEHRSEGILVIQDHSLFFDDHLRPLAEAVHALLSPRPKLIQNCTILLHSRSNPIQFCSYLITGEEALQRRSDEDNVEQGVAPQSATRSESNSGGGDNPQPESKPRSR